MTLLRLASTVTALIAALCLLLKSKSTQNVDRTLKVGIESEPMTLNKSIAGDYASICVLSHVYEGLVRVDHGMIIKLAAAKAMTISESKTEWDFYIDDVTWSDGTSVKAQDFKRGWIKSIKARGPLSSIFLCIKGVKEFMNNSISEEDLGIIVVNDKHLKILLNANTPYFTYILALPVFAPEHRNNSVNVFNGPFVIKSTSEGLSNIWLAKNTSYKHSDKIFLDNINFISVEDESTRLQMVCNGELDITRAEDQIPHKYNKNTNIKIEVMGQILETTMLVLNGHHEILKNKSIRRALYESIDKHALVENIACSGTVAYRFVPPIVSKNKHVKRHHRLNIKQANKCLTRSMKELNLSKQDIANSLELSFAVNQISQNLICAIQDQWYTNLGLNIRIKQENTITCNTKRENGTFCISAQSWIGDFPDAMSFLETFQANGYYSKAGIIEKFEEALEQARLEKDNHKRDKILTRAENILLNSYLMIPLTHPSSVFLFNNRLKGVIFNPISNFPICSFSSFS